MANKAWVCRACLRWHNPPRDPITGKRSKPTECMGADANPPCHSRLFLHFDSQVEGRHFMQLIQLERAGRVRGMVHHPRFELVTVNPDRMLQVVGLYVADVAYEWLPDNQQEWVYRVDDVKPRSDQALDPLFVWKRRHFEAQTGLTITLIQ